MRSKPREIIIVQSYTCSQTLSVCPQSAPGSDSGGLQEDISVGIFPQNVGSGHWSGCTGTSRRVLGRRLAHPTTKETSRGLLCSRGAAGIPSQVLISSGSKIVRQNIFPHLSGVVWLVYGEEWIGKQTVQDSTRDRGGSPGQSVSTSWSPQSGPPALLLHAVHRTGSPLPTTHHCCELSLSLSHHTLIEEATALSPPAGGGQGEETETHGPWSCCHHLPHLCLRSANYPILDIVSLPHTANAQKIEKERSKEMKITN